MRCALCRPSEPLSAYLQLPRLQRRPNRTRSPVCCPFTTPRCISGEWKRGGVADGGLAVGGLHGDAVPAPPPPQVPWQRFLTQVSATSAGWVTGLRSQQPRPGLADRGWQVHPGSPKGAVLKGARCLVSPHGSTAAPRRPLRAPRGGATWHVAPGPYGELTRVDFWDLSRSDMQQRQRQTQTQTQAVGQQ